MPKNRGNLENGANLSSTAIPFNRKDSSQPIVREKKG